MCITTYHARGPSSRPLPAALELRPGHRTDAPVLRAHADTRAGAAIGNLRLVPPLAPLPDVAGRRARMRADRVAVEALVDQPGDVLRLGRERPRLLALEREEGPQEEDGGGHGRGGDGAAEERSARAQGSPPRRREVHGVQRVEGAAAEEDERHQPDLPVLAPLEELVDV